MPCLIKETKEIMSPATENNKVRSSDFSLKMKDTHRIIEAAVKNSTPTIGALGKLLQFFAKSLQETLYNQRLTNWSNLC